MHQGFFLGREKGGLARSDRFSYWRGGGVPDLLVSGKSVPSGSQKHVCRIMAVLGGRNTQVVLSSQEITGEYFFLIFPFSQMKKNHVPWVLFKKK